MEFHQVRYFLAACDHMNFTRAAEMCAVSQPALTRAVQKLEAELGGPLFVRDGRRFALTPLGSAMRTQLGRLEETRRAALDAGREITGTGADLLEIGIMCSVGPARLGRALSAFQAASPRSRIVLHDVWAVRAREMLLAGSLDCAILARHDPLPDRFEGLPLLREPMALAMAPDDPLASGRLTLSRLSGVRYIDRVRCEFRYDFFDALKRRGIEVDVRYRSDREDWVQTAVASGHGVSVVPRDMVLHGGLTIRPIEDMTAERIIELVTVRGREASRALRRFRRFLEEWDWAARAPLERIPLDRAG